MKSTVRVGLQVMCPIDPYRVSRGSCSTKESQESFEVLRHGSGLSIRLAIILREVRPERCRLSAFCQPGSE